MGTNDTNVIKRKRQHFVGREGRKLICQIESKIKEAEELQEKGEKVEADKLFAEVKEIIETELEKLGQSIKMLEQSKKRRWI